MIAVPFLNCGRKDSGSFPDVLLKSCCLAGQDKTENHGYWSDCIALIESREEFAENWPAGEIEELSEEPELPPPKLAPLFRLAAGTRLPLGLGLLIYVINRVGMQPLFDALVRIGFGFFVILGLSGLRHVLRTIAMRAAVPPEHRRITFRQAFAARLGGEAISFLTFTGHSR